MSLKSHINEAFQKELMLRSKWVFLPYSVMYATFYFFLNQDFVFQNHLNWLINVVILLTCTRSFFAFKYQTATPKQKNDYFKWHNTAIVIKSFAIGYFIFICNSKLPSTSRDFYLTLTVIFMSVAGAMFSFTPVPKIRLTYTSVVLGSALAGFLVQPDETVRQPFSILVGVFYLFLEAQSRTYFKEFKNLVYSNIEVTDEKAKLQDILDSASGFIVYVDMQGNLLTHSKNLHAKAKIPSEAKQLPESHPLANCLAKAKDCQKEHKTCEVEIDGHWFMLNLTAVTSPSEGYVIFGTPIDELISARHEVEAQRSKAMQTARLSAVGELAGGISHEINNPLSVIVMCVKNAQLLLKQKTVDPDKIQPILTKITDTSLRISKIIQGLRQFARDSSGDPLTPIPVQEVIDHTLDFVREKFKNRGIELRYTATEPVKILGRRTDLSQAMFNIIHNAVDAVTPLTERWIQLEVSTDPKFAYISITDSGPGLDPKVKEKLFVPFVTTKAVGANTGLGLSITKGILDQHNGDIYLDPSKTKTCFVFKIPLALEESKIAS